VTNGSTTWQPWWYPWLCWAALPSRWSSLQVNERGFYPSHVSLLYRGFPPWSQWLFLTSSLFSKDWSFEYCLGSLRPLPPGALWHVASDVELVISWNACSYPSSCFWPRLPLCVGGTCTCGNETATLLRWPSSRKTRGCTGSSSAWGKPRHWPPCHDENNVGGVLYVGKDANRSIIRQ